MTLAEKMSADGIWWFYKVDAAKFEAVQSEFELAIEKAPALPEVSTRPPREGQVYDGLWLDVIMGNDSGIELYHKPFEAIAYRIIFHQFSESGFERSQDDKLLTTYEIPEKEESLTFDTEDLVECVWQNRILPPAILLVGMGEERFAQLPGYLGNMLIHPQAVEQTMASVTHILDVDRKVYSERATPLLAFARSYEQAAKDALEALQAIPNALERAKNEGAGLLAITSWGCP